MKKIDALHRISFDTADENEKLLKLILQKFEVKSSLVEITLDENGVCRIGDMEIYLESQSNSDTEDHNKITVEADVHPIPRQHLNTTEQDNTDDVQIFNIEDIPVILDENLHNFLPVDIIEEKYQVNENNTSFLQTSTSSIGDYFVHPKTPERKGKKRSEKVSFVLTSSSRKRDMFSC
ncbi:hypothetical protein PPYR_02381 [Photinus pyralis]|uniref:Uncharacterized protein n=1 Tax=Photinus pyralis TaxID=7054 RepID=A0A5N4B725_PHOPY|nr:hypothetical protein PPYR_02381 [Photinus pyralis]